MKDTIDKKLLHTILDCLRDLDYIKKDDIPNIDLYMDQVTTFMDEHLSGSKRADDDKILTKTMINNYTKNDLLPPPIKKKYTKEHIYILIFTYYFKSFLSIGDIQNILTPLKDMFYKNEDSSFNLEDIYNGIVEMERTQSSAFLKEVMNLYSKSREVFPKKEDATPEEQSFLTSFVLVCILGYDVYTKKLLIERLIDRAFTKPTEDDKQEPKEKKEKTN